MTDEAILRVAGDGETADSESVEAAARGGSKVGILRAMRLALSRAFDHPDTTATALAAITIRIADLTTEIDSLLAREAEQKKGEAGDAGGSSNVGSGGRKWRPEAI